MSFQSEPGDLVIHGGRPWSAGMPAEEGPVQTIVAREGRIDFIGVDADVIAHPAARRLDAGGGAIVPGLIDAHTHLVFAGDRVGEFAARSRGASYEEIARTGGGIWRTVLETRAASEEALFAFSKPRLIEMARRGVTTVEIKSGYGLTLEAERKMLRAARRLGAWSGLDVVTTFLALHVVPRDWPGTRAQYVAAACEWLRVLHGEGLVDGVDAFVEEGAFTAEDARAIAGVASELGLPLRLHADQLTSAKGGALAASLKARSADHLEHLAPDEAPALAAAGVVATLLPIAALYVCKGAKPPVAALRESGVKMAVATDFNPGSAPALDLLTACAVGMKYFGLTIEEALSGVTANPAQALGLGASHGVLQVGTFADLVVLTHPHPGALFYELGRSPIRHVLKRGTVLDLAV